MDNKQENLKEKVLEAYENGNICYTTCVGVMKMPFHEFVKQPLDGMLYDINRDNASILAMLGKGDIKWINDYALTRLVEYYAEEKQSTIEKACEWLKENLSTSLHDNSMSNDDAISWVETVSVEREPSEEFIERFKKEMEE